MAQESDYKTTIKITGDTKDGEQGIQRVQTKLEKLKNTLNSWRTSLQSGMRSLAVFHLASEGVKSIIKDVTTLISYFKELRSSVERAAFASSVSKAAYATTKLADAQRDVNTQLKEQITLIQRAISLREMSSKGAKTFSDEQRAVDRAVALAGVSDPRQRQALENSFALEDEARKRSESGEDIAARIRRLTAEANAYDKGASRAQNVINQSYDQAAKESEIQGQLLQKYGNKSLASRRFDAMFGLETGEEELSASAARMQKIEETRRAAAEEKKTFEEEAAYRRAQIQILEKQQKDFEQLGTSAKEVADATWRKMDEADSAANKKLSDKLAANEAADKWARDFERASPAEKVTMLQDKENSARGRLESLRSALDAEMGKSVAERDQARMDELRTGMEAAQDEMFAARRQREGMAGPEGAAGGSFSLGGGSRLNAMGLGAGSGVQRVQQEMANSLKDLVRLGRDQLAALKEISTEDSGATFQ